MVIAAGVIALMLDYFRRSVMSQPNDRVLGSEIDASAGGRQGETELPATGTSLIYLGRVDTVFFDGHIFKASNRSRFVIDSGTAGN